MNRLAYPLSHEWHVAINGHHDDLRRSAQEWKRWMYEAKKMADEVPRLAMLFRRDREADLCRPDPLGEALNMGDGAYRP